MQLFVSFLLLFASLSVSNHPVPSNHPDDSSDFTIVVKDNAVIFDVLENDNIEGEVKDFSIISQPLFGKAEINDDQSVTYIPATGLCDEMDEFTYYIKDDKGVDTISVYVEILCENLTVINGFSPMTDKDPNSFTILGVENYPDNTLYIFNNDGNEIYYKEGYRNEWTGIREGEILSTDHVYYYVFNDGEGNTLSGYVQINEPILDD